VPDALLVLAPRHPQRFDAVAAWLGREGIDFRRRSGGEPCGAQTEVLLLDTLGELVDFYAAADVAFVAGSLVPGGGHNLLEPAALGRPVLTGPDNSSAPQIARLLAGCGAARIVADGARLAEAVSALLLDPAERERMGRLGRDAVAANRGAVERVLELVEPLLDAGDADRR
jgi:3-deoxy-D-manno-octulosonic-acid transferase